MAATEVTILGTGRFAGSSANIVDYSANESAPSLDMNDMRGGVGSVEFTVVEEPGKNGTILLSGQRFRLSDPYSGAINGVMDGVETIDGAGVSVTGSNLLLPLVAERRVPAFTGTLGGAIMYYMSLCGVTEGIQVDLATATTPVNLPSWTGEVWQHIKKLANVFQFEIAAVSNTIIIRRARLRWVDVDHYNTIRTSIGGASAAREVIVHNYNTKWEANKQVYPDPATSIVDRPIISVGAGEVVTTNYPVNMWMNSILPPTQVSSLPIDNTSSTTVYSVVDKDGAPVSIGDWQNGGGVLSLAIGLDGKSIDVTVRGMSTNERAPYRIASSSEDLEYQYAALYIAATGVSFKDQVISSRTGASEQYLPVDSVVEIDDPMVGTLDRAYSVLANAILGLSGEAQTFEATATRVNRRGETGELAYPSFGEFDSEWPTETFSEFDTWAGTMTFAAFDAYQGSLVATSFETQAFGSIAGARARYRDVIYRILDATSSPATHKWSATADTTFGDFTEGIATWDPTFGQYDTFWGADITVGQHSRQPLAKPLL